MALKISVSSGCSHKRVFWRKLTSTVWTLSKANYPPQYGWDSCNQLKALIGTHYCSLSKKKFCHQTVFKHKLQLLSGSSVCQPTLKILDL